MPVHPLAKVSGKQKNFLPLHRCYSDLELQTNIESMQSLHASLLITLILCHGQDLITEKCLGVNAAHLKSRNGKTGEPQA
ncbi:Hypothetical predicted protein [Podarcis lilfordi]|uniref:Uncharacterized protein n=1 Tax=Podarcis lilfordi TaxID=74358 RepID=A0AA35P3K2_9SAUR|nr:Hypothetical predicted protein [Podarcis lilfordi]